MTTGEVHEARRLISLIDTHQEKTGRTANIAVAGSKYGTIENYIAFCDRNINPYFESLDNGRHDTGKRQNIFEPSDFIYNPDDDLFI